MSKYIGSQFDDFLDEEGIQQSVTAAALKRVMAWQINEAMKVNNITKAEMTRRMNTSRAALNRLLDSEDTGVTLTTLARASEAVGCSLKIEMDISGGTHRHTATS